MSISRTREFIQSFFEAMSEGDTDAIVNAYHPEGRVETMGNTLISGSRGLDEIKSFAPAVLESFPNKLKFTSEEAVIFSKSFKLSSPPI